MWPPEAGPDPSGSDHARVTPGRGGQTQGLRACSAGTPSSRRGPVPGGRLVLQGGDRRGQCTAPSSPVPCRSPPRDHRPRRLLRQQSLDPGPRRLRRAPRRRAVVGAVRHRRCRLRRHHGARPARSATPGRGRAPAPRRYAGGRGGGRRAACGGAHRGVPRRSARHARPAATERSRGGDRGRDRAPVVVAGRLPGPWPGHSERDPRPRRPGRAPAAADGRREPQLLGSAADAEDRPRGRTGQRHLDPRRASGDLPRPVRGVLRFAARAHGAGGRGRGVTGLRGMGRAAVRRRAGGGHRPAAPREAGAGVVLLRGLPHGSRHHSARLGRPGPDAPRHAQRAGCRDGAERTGPPGRLDRQLPGREAGQQDAATAPLAGRPARGRRVPRRREGRAQSRRTGRAAAVRRGDRPRDVLVRAIAGRVLRDVVHAGTQWSRRRAVSVSEASELALEAERRLGSRLAEHWPEGTGLKGFLTTVDHKRIGRRYIATAALFFGLAGVEALVMRTQLLRPEASVVSAELYDQLFTLHGTAMIFFFATPMLFGFGNFLFPLMLGTRDMAFPRLNAFGYWVFASAGVVMFASLFVGRAPDGGWFAYVPLTTARYTPQANLDVYSLGLLFLGVSTTAGAINFIVPALKLRAPGMTLARTPVFVWALVVTSFMVVFALPPLNAANAMLFLDRRFGFPLFHPAPGGGAGLWPHPVWPVGHPGVYIIVLSPPRPL